MQNLLVFIAFLSMIISAILTCLSIYYHILYRKSKKVKDLNEIEKKQKDKWHVLAVVLFILAIILFIITVNILYPSIDSPRIDTESVKVSSNEQVNNNVILMLFLINLLMFIFSSNILDRVFKKNNAFNLNELEKIFLKIASIFRTNIVFTIYATIILSIKIALELLSSMI